MTDPVARFMAAVSTTAAVLSMFIAYRTHRRLRPRIKGDVGRFTIRDVDVDGLRKRHLCLQMRVVNEGASRVSVEEIRLEFRYHVRGAVTTWGTKPSRTYGCTFKLADPLVVEPMDGSKFESIFECQKINPHKLRVRSGYYELSLSNGRQVRRELNWWEHGSARARFEEAWRSGTRARG